MHIFKLGNQWQLKSNDQTATLYVTSSPRILNNMFDANS